MANTDSGAELDTPKNSKCRCACVRVNSRRPNEAEEPAKASITSNGTDNVDFEALSRASERAGRIPKSARAVPQPASAYVRLPSTPPQFVRTARSHRNVFFKYTLTNLASGPSQLDVWTASDEDHKTIIYDSGQHLPPTYTAARRQVEELSLALEPLCGKIFDINHHNREVILDPQPSAPSASSGVQQQCNQWSYFGLGFDVEELGKNITMEFEIEEVGESEDEGALDNVLDAALDGRRVGSDTGSRLVGGLVRGEYNRDLPGPPHSPYKTSTSQIKITRRAIASQHEVEDQSNQHHSSPLSMSSGTFKDDASHGDTMHPTTASPSLLPFELSSEELNLVGRTDLDVDYPDNTSTYYTHLQPPSRLSTISYNYHTPSRNDDSSIPRYMPRCE